jgi:serine/threonine-protein kinase
VPAWARPPAPPAIEGYDIGELVGRGGMAVVYKARQRSLNRPVALKMLLVGPYFDADEASRIRAEAEAIARLQHPNVVHVYEVGECDGRPYLLMEFVDGGTLADRLKQGPVPADQAAAWAEAIARGIHAAHRRGIVHRDLKPANVLMTGDGVPKITDFGIARRLDDPADKTRTGLVIGTPAYMAPEQAEGRKGVGPPADVWAVGAVLYEMLTGRRPFDGGSSHDLLRRVSSEKPPRPSRVRPTVPARLEAICLKCLQKDPANRYPTAEALADDLARARGQPTPAAPPRRRWLAPVAVVAVCLLAVVLVGKPWGRPGAGGDPATQPGGPSIAPGPDPVGPSPLAQAPVGKPVWEQFQITAADEDFQQLAFPTRDVGYAASRAGVHRTADGGQTWTRVSGQARGHVFALTFADADHGWLSGDGLYRTADGGRTWNPVELPGADPKRGVRALALGTGGWGLAGGATGSGDVALFRRKPGDDGWEKIDAVAWDGKDGPHHNWVLSALAVAGPADGWAVLFGAAEAGVVLHTADGGDTWTPVFEADADLYHIHFADPRRGWLAGSRGRLWATSDGGLNWTAQANPEGADPVSCLAFARGGEPFGLAPLEGRCLMTDDGRSWQVVKAGLTGRTPAAVVVDPGRAYVLGRDGKVARYTDPRVKLRP